MGKSSTTSAEVADKAMESHDRVNAAAEHRSVPKQIDCLAPNGKAALNNADLPPRMIQDTIRSLEEVAAGQVHAYKFG